MAKKVGSIYAEIRAKLDKYEKDLAKAQNIAQQSSSKIQQSINKISFDGVASSARKMTAALASVYAVVGSLRGAFEMAVQGEAANKQEKAFANLAASAGKSSDMILDSLERVSNGMVSNADLIKASGTAMMMGIPADKLVDMMRIAEATSRQTGQSVTEAFNDISLGVARQSKMILDNLGIVVSVEKANQEYAKSLNKTAEALTDAEKKQAFMNAVMTAGNDLIKRIGSGEGGFAGVARATKEWDEALSNLSKLISEESNPLFEAVAGVLRRINMEFKAGRQAAAEYGSSVENIDARIAALNAKHGDMASRQSWGYNEPDDREYRRLVAMRKQMNLQGVTDFGRGNVSGRYGATFEPQYYGAMRVSDNEIPYDVDARWKSYTDSLENAAKNSKKNKQPYENDFSGSWDYMWKNDQLDKMRRDRFLDTGYSESLKEAELKDYEKRLEKARAESKFIEEQQDNIRKIQSEYEKTFGSMIELTERTAEAMQDNFSNLFFDAMTGELKSLEDYADAVFRSIARMISDLAAQEMTRGLFGPEMQGGGLLSSLAGLFGGSNLQPMDQGTAMALVRHSGGVVGSSGGGMRRVPKSSFSFAPRLHNGLMPDEFPAVLQKGEQVIPRGWRGDGGSNININITAPNGRVDRESISNLQAGVLAAMSRAARRNN